MAAIEWARALPEEGEREVVIADSIRTWASRDSDAALEWILAQPADVTLDRGQGRLAVYFARRQPQLSIQLLERIVSAVTFKNTRRTVEHHWRSLPDDASAREGLMAQVEQIAQARLRRRTSAEAADAAESPQTLDGAS